MSVGKCWNCCVNTFGEHLVYTTNKELRVQNRLVTGVYLLGMITIFVYVVAYTIILEKGYQFRSYPRGYVSTKVKGLGFDYRGTSHNDSYYEGLGLVHPALEMNGLFLTTANVQTWQERGICNGIDECDHDDNCTEGDFDYDGIQNGECSNGYCQQYRWCPGENDTITESNLIYGVDNFTIFLKVALNFEEFGIRLVNTEDRLGTGALIPGYNSFTVSDILEECGIEMADIQNTGMLITGDITYYCDFDVSKDCDPYPKFHWHREDIDKDTVSIGFNFRKLFYSVNSQHETDRLLVKFIGIRFSFNIQGYGGRFDLGTFSSTLGSGIALAAIATAITELLLRHCISERSFYTKRRTEVVSLEEEEQWVRESEAGLGSSSDSSDKSPKSSSVSG